MPMMPHITAEREGFFIKAVERNTNLKRLIFTKSGLDKILTKIKSEIEPPSLVTVIISQRASAPLATGFAWILAGFSQLLKV